MFVITSKRSEAALGRAIDLADLLIDCNLSASVRTLIAVVISVALFNDSAAP